MPTRQKKKILIIDDSPIALEIAKSALEEHYTVYTSPGLQDFEYKFPKVEPDGIIVDINMPEIYGDDICRVFKEGFGFKNTPIILFSDLSEEELKMRSEDSGADGYISKSWGPKRLLEVVKEIVGL